MKTLARLAIALLLATPLPALAQLGTFWNNGTGPQLSGDDVDRLLASVAKLNADPSVQVGGAAEWSNSTSGSHGTSTVARIFESDGMQCHAMHFEIAAKGREPPKPYELTWCRISDGSWKIKS